ncbi:hypothetical protein [Winogradskyella sp.]|uniref:hypothetical protein n=1 Tax=Winogradskyella sp. TaxID=1883156 RepID=UPI002636DE96|nr:hypothetical protein [Winogradskyella sp.]
MSNTYKLKPWNYYFKAFLLFLILTNCLFVRAQANDTEAALYNIGFGAVFSTVGAIINKPKDEPLGKVIKKSLWQGALGGYITFESKRILREAQRQEQWEYFWAAKLVNAAGTSIKENAALNYDFYDRWHLNIGFNRIEFNTKGKFSLNYKLMPIAFVFNIDAIFRYNFELKESLRIGEFIYSSSELQTSNNLNNVFAAASAGYIVYDQMFLDDFKTSVHEVIHIYQSNDFQIFNTYLNKPLANWSSNNSVVNWLNNHLYVEYHYAILRPIYMFETETANSFYDNFLEREAGFYSHTLWNN